MTSRELAAAGWTALVTDAFSKAIGPMWTRGEAGMREVGLPCTQIIANRHIGVVHGGALMTFADIALGLAVVDTIGGPWCSTIQLQYHFAAPVQIGSLLICTPEVLRRTRKIVFIRGLFTVEGDVVGSADGLYNVFEPKA